MKKNVFLISAPCTLLFSMPILMGCGNRTNGNASDADTNLYELAQEDGPGYDDPRTLPAVEVDFGGKHYVAKVSIAPSDSLPMVDDSYGDPYKDNEATVRVTVDDTVLIDKVFGKADFAAAIGKDTDMAKQIFCGIAFDKVSNRGIVFRAQLSRPGDMEGGTSFFVTYPLAGGKPIIERDNTREMDIAMPD